MCVGHRSLRALTQPRRCPVTHIDRRPTQDIQEPTSKEHTWKSASAGDDVIFISTEHPQYSIGTYYIGIYGVYDTEYEIEAKLVEAPLNLDLQVCASFAPHPKMQGAVECHVAL